MNFKKHKRIILFCLGWFSMLTAWARDPYNPNITVPYKTYIFGIQDTDLALDVAQNSLLIIKESEPPKTVQALKKRAEQDLINIQKTVARHGYFDADFDYFVDIRTDPVTVYVKVKLNTQYKIGAFKFKSDPPNNTAIHALEQDVGKVGIVLGQPALKKTIQKATTDSINYLQNHGYPFARLYKDRIIIDREKKEMQVALLLSPGPSVRFGNTVLEENGRVTGNFIRRHMRWRKGQIYSEEKVLHTLQTLNNTRLFEEVKITHDDRIDENGLMNMYIKLKSDGKNKIVPEKTYVSGLGLELGGSWEHRNLLGTDAVMKTSLAVGKRRKRLKINLMNPDVFMLNLNLNAMLNLFNDQYRPFDKKGGSLSAIFDYPINDLWQAYGGVGAETYRLEVAGRGQDRRYVNLPLGVRLNYTDNAARPKQGVILDGHFIGHSTVFESLRAFTQFSLESEVFVPLTKDKRLFSRLWGNVGLSPGAGKNILPKDKRYYGGMGTHEPVRGYAFQMAGPLNGNIPLGGGSALSFGAEMYYDITEDFSVLWFSDWGTTYDRQFPDFQTKLLWGVGVGLRYRTTYGELYFDVASPIDRRGRVDKPVEIYAGIKQPT